MTMVTDNRCRQRIEQCHRRYKSKKTRQRRAGAINDSAREQALCRRRAAQSAPVWYQMNSQQYSDLRSRLHSRAFIM